MGLFRRISDIISANLNEMVEGFEDPEKMLKQAIREMEESIATATQETARVLANEKLISKELTGNELQATEWQKKAETAVAAGDDALARRALARKQEHQKLVVALKDQSAVGQDASRILRHQLDGMQAKLAEAKRKLSTLVARKKAADYSKRVSASGTVLETAACGNDAFVKFDRLKDKVERAEAEAEAFVELRGMPQQCVTDMGVLGDEAVEAELRAIKDRATD